MPRARDPNRDKAFEIWKQHNGEMKLKDIASELNVSEGTVRGWKAKDKWGDASNGTFQSKIRSAPKEKKQQSQKKRGGNPNPINQFSHRNNPKFIHGLRSKFLHEEQVEIMKAMEDLSIADQIWLQIEIKFSAIIRMQKIMWVENADDHLKVESGSSWGDGGGSESFKVSFSYERYESYIKAQARAMAEYRNLAKQFLELSHGEDERRLKLEGMRLSIDKTKAEIELLKGEEEETEDDGFLEALQGKVDEVWDDAEED